MTPYDATEQSAQARDRALHVVRDESAPFETPCTDAATYCRIASRKFDAVDGEEEGDPALAYRSLWEARSYAQAALREAERELERFGFAHGFEGSPFGPPAASVRAECQDNAKGRCGAFAEHVVSNLSALCAPLVPAAE